MTSAVDPTAREERAMSSVAEKRRYTPEEYLALERESPFKSEYYRGEIFAMSGASREHNLIAGNFHRSISTQLLDRPCEAYMSDMRVRVLPTGLYTYPDLSAVCGEPQFEDNQVDILLNPTVLIEVLSPSTERYDRGLKFAQYRRVESLREFLLASQEEVLVEHYVRRGEEWVLTAYDRRDDVLRLESIGCEVSLRDAYMKVEVPEGGAGTGEVKDR